MSLSPRRTDRSAELVHFPAAPLLEPVPEAESSQDYVLPVEEEAWEDRTHTEPIALPDLVQSIRAAVAAELREALQPMNTELALIRRRLKWLTVGAVAGAVLFVSVLVLSGCGGGANRCHDATSRPNQHSTENCTRR